MGEDQESKTMKKKKKSEKIKFFIGIQDVEHELELIGSPGSSEYSGISYSFQRDTENLQIFHIDVSIPQSLYENGELLVSFRVEAYDTTRGVGIDNVGIIGMCSSPSTNTSSFPSMEPSLIPRAPSVEEATEEATESVPPSVWSNSDPSTNPSTEFVGFDWDDIVPSSQPSSTPNTDGDLDCVDGDGVIITFEDFESSEQTESWKGGQLSDGFGSSFLGQIDQQNPQVSKAFTVPITASSVDLSFDLYKTKHYNFAPHEDVSPEKKEMKEKKKMKAMKKIKSVKFKTKRNSESLKSRRMEKMKSLKTKSKPVDDQESKTIKKRKKVKK